MRRVVLLMIALGACGHFLSAQTPTPEGEALLRQVFAIARTNSAAALKLCDSAVAASPTNARPLIIRAQLHDRLRQYEEGIRDLTAAAKLAPDSASVWQGRGELHFKAGKFKESVADFDRVLSLAPGQSPHHWQRGISLYYAGRFTEGRRQFESHQSVNPNDVENAVWHFLCAARESGVTNARARMLSVGPDARVPMHEIDALFRGKGSPEKVLAAANAAPIEHRRDALFHAHLYLGLYFDAAGEPVKAREHMAKAVNEFQFSHYMGDVARVHWRTLQAR